MNRFLAAVALFGAFGTVALALALTPEAQTSASDVKAARYALAISAAETPAPSVAAAEPPKYEIAALPPRAAKSDRLTRSYRAPQPALKSASRPVTRVVRADRSAEPEVLRAPVRRETAEPDPATAPHESATTHRAAPGPTPKSETDLDPALSQAPMPIPEQTDADAVAEQSPQETAEDIAEEIAEEAAAAPAEDAAGGAADDSDATDVAAEDDADGAAAEAATEQAAVATRSAAVTTDVNMRARPANGAAVVQVVPRRSKVEVIACDYWCEVLYDGRRGFIYKSFVSGASS